MIYNTLHQKLKIVQHQPLYKSGVKPGVLEGQFLHHYRHPKTTENTNVLIGKHVLHSYLICKPSDNMVYHYVRCLLYHKFSKYKRLPHKYQGTDCCILVRDRLQ